MRLQCRPISVKLTGKNGRFPPVLPGPCRHRRGTRLLRFQIKGYGQTGHTTNCKERNVDTDRRTFGKTRRAIIHVGTEKTGTTSLQAALADNREMLRGHGILFPISPGKKNHTRLVAASEDNGVIDNIKAHILAARRESEAALRKSFQSDFQKELNSGPAWHTLVLSSELIHSRLHNPSEFERLLSYIRGTVDDIVVVAVLRRQDQLALSRFSTAIRAGHDRFDDVFGDIAEHAFKRLPPNRDVSDWTQYYDYYAFLNRFTSLVGPENVLVRLYEVDGQRTDPVVMIANVLNLDASEFTDSGPDLNPAMSAEAQYVISQLNRRIPPHLPTGRRNEEFVTLKRRVEAEMVGPGRKVPRAEAEAFLHRFADSNDRLRATFFPDRRSLFDEDFSTYPESVDYSDFPTRLAPTIDAYASALEPSLPPYGLKRAIGKMRRLWAN